MTDTHDPSTPETSLESWKAIASHLNRDVRTVKRWEKNEGLPVRRHVHQARSSVYAFVSELDAWWAARAPRATQDPPASRMGHVITRFAFASMLLLAVSTPSSVPNVVRAAAAPQSQDMTTRRAWSDRSVDTSGGISPDGRLLTFVDWETGDLAVRDLIAGQSRHLTNKDWKGSWKDSPEEALWSIFSADGKQVAYAWYSPQQNGYDLRLVGIEAGSTPRILYANPDVSLIQPMDWSADGKQIIATLRRRGDKTYQIVAVAVADGAVRVLKSLDWRCPEKMSLSPDDRYVAYDFAPLESKPERDIFVLAIDGSLDTALIQSAADDGSPIWTRGGDRILFISDRRGTPGLWVTAVSQGKPVGAPELLKPDVGHVTDVIGLTKGQALYYGLQTGMSQVFTARLDPAGAIVLDPAVPLSQRSAGSTAAPDWSADGKELVYLTRRWAGSAPGVVIVIRSLATGQERDLGTDATAVYRPLWSPDGRSFIAHGQDAKGRQGLLRIDARSGAATLLVQSKLYITSPTWSPDGKAVFYCDSGSLVRRDLERATSVVLAKVASSPWVDFAVSPDGKSLVIARDGMLEVMPSQGGEAKELVRPQEGQELIGSPATAWTPDGRYVLFITRAKEDRAKTTLWSVAARGGAPNKIDLTMSSIRDIRIHPDGQRIAFTAGEGRMEIWVLENFLRGPNGAK